jgi:hypothetical protein
VDAVKVDTAALGHLRSAKNRLTRQQFKTLRGQILAGDPTGAMKGLERILLLNGSNAVKNH